VTDPCVKRDLRVDGSFFDRENRGPRRSFAFPQSSSCSWFSLFSLNNLCYSLRMAPRTRSPTPRSTISSPSSPLVQASVRKHRYEDDDDYSTESDYSDDEGDRGGRRAPSSSGSSAVSSHCFSLRACFSADGGEIVRDDRRVCSSSVSFCCCALQRSLPFTFGMRIERMDL